MSAVLQCATGQAGSSAPGVSMPTTALCIRLHCKAQPVARQSTDSPATAESGMLLPGQANSLLFTFCLPATSPIFATALPVFPNFIQRHSHDQPMPCCTRLLWW